MALFYVLYRINKRAETDWYEFAERLGITYEPRSGASRLVGTGHLTGVHRGRSD